MIELGRAGMRLETSSSLPVGSSLAARLSYRDAAVELRGQVRWCREAAGSGDDGARWELGVAFTEVGEVSGDSIWRSLAVYNA